MSDSSVESMLMLVVAVCLGGVLLGLFGLLARRRTRARWWPWAAGALAVVLGGSAVAAAVLELPLPVQVPLHVLAAVWALFWALNFAAVARLGSLVLAMVRDPRAQGGLVLAAGPLIALWTVTYLDQGPTIFNDRQIPGMFGADVSTLQEVPGCQAVTDQGRPLHLFQGPDQDTSTAEAVAVESNWIKERSLTERVIRTGPPDANYNCHGWVFAGGLYWLRGYEVDAILDDNGYQTVTAPQPGDVAIFRSTEGAVVHSGLVRTASADGLVLIESKWGWLGRFVHTPEGQCYGPRCTYYHSDRGGNRVQGVAGETPTVHPITSAPATE